MQLRETLSFKELSSFLRPKIKLSGLQVVENQDHLPSCYQQKKTNSVARTAGTWLCETAIKAALLISQQWISSGNLGNAATTVMLSILVSNTPF